MVDEVAIGIYNTQNTFCCLKPIKFFQKSTENSVASYICTYITSDKFLLTTESSYHLAIIR